MGAIARRQLLKTILAGVLLTATDAARSAPLDYRQLLARPRPTATKRIPYGPAPSQFGELWMPTGAGPFPVVMLIHGGCWRADLPGIELMAYAADDLRQHGFAVWNVEYHRLGEPGGGYPGTFADIAAAADELRVLAKSYPLQLDKVAAVGHSSGGHLALWAAARPRLPKTSALRRDRPLPITQVVSLAGIADLAAFRDHGPPACGGPAVIDQLVNTATRGPWDMFLDTSPTALLPIGVPQVIVSGALDPIVPAVFGNSYAAQAAAAGDRVQNLVIPDASHFELIDPQSSAFDKIRSLILTK
jgi:acetyl esterase/lipase